MDLLLGSAQGSALGLSQNGSKQLWLSEALASVQLRLEDRPIGIPAVRAVTWSEGYETEIQSRSKEGSHTVDDRNSA